MQRRLPWLAVLLLGVGCGSPTSTLDYMQVATTVERSGGLSTPVTITTTMRNSGTHLLTLETNPCPVRFRVESMSGTRIELALQNCFMYSRKVTLTPGQSFSFIDQWDGRDRNGVYTSGTYRIIGQPFFDEGPHSAPVIVQFAE